MENKEELRKYVRACMQEANLLVEERLRNLGKQAEFDGKMALVQSRTAAYVGKIEMTGGLIYIFVSN